MVASVREYNQEQARMHARQQELLKRVLDKPFNARHVDLDLEVELQKTEEWLLDNPPLYELKDEQGQGTGQFRQRRKGLSRRILFPRGPLPRYPRDEFQTIPVNQWSDWLTGQDAVDLRPFVPYILDQNGVGSCASESMTQCLQICRAVDRQDPEKLNPWFAYHTVSGGVDGGSSLYDNVNFALEHGVASQVIWPRSKGWRATPSDEAYDDGLKYRLLEVFSIDTWEEFGSCLLYGMPVYFGYSGHAICGVTVISTTKVQYANSWGNWGDQGFGTLSKNSIAWGYGVYGFRVVVRRKEPSGRSGRHSSLIHAA